MLVVEYICEVLADCTLVIVLITMCLSLGCVVLYVAFIFTFMNGILSFDHSYIISECIKSNITGVEIDWNCHVTNSKIVCGTSYSPHFTKCYMLVSQHY